MRFLLIYYAALAEEQVDGEPRVFTDVSAVSAYAKLRRVDFKGSVYLREAEAFDGQPERSGDELPRGVVLFGHGASLDRVREAYEEAEVDVEIGHLDDEDNIPEFAKAEQGDDRFKNNLNALKAHATQLGIPFSPAIGFANLHARILKAEEERVTEGGE